MLKKCSPWCILRECRGMPNHDQQALCTREGHVESSLVGQEADALATRVVGRAHRAEEDHLALASLVRIDGLHVVTASNLLAKSILLRSVRREDPHVSNHVRFLFGGSLLEAGNDHRAHSHFEHVLPGPVGTLGRGLQVKEQKWGEDSVKGTSGVLQHARGKAESSGAILYCSSRSKAVCPVLRSRSKRGRESSSCSAFALNTVGGNCRSSPTMTQRVDPASWRGTNAAGSDACAASSMTTTPKAT